MNDEYELKSFREIIKNTARRTWELKRERKRASNFSQLLNFNALETNTIC